MNWINNIVRPKIRSFLNKKESPDNLWVKCPVSGEMVFYKDLEANQWVVPGSGHHMRIKARDRLNSFFDGGIYEELEVPETVQDPLKFRSAKRYSDQLRDDRNKTGLKDAILAAAGHVVGQKMVVCAHDFDFRGGSLGTAAGETIITSMAHAAKNRLPFIMFTTSGGARMQEGVLSLMQMPRTTIGVQMLNEAGLPYIVVLTNPTTGGVTASYAMLGDVHIAEPGAEIGFAGARVIEQTIREKLPEGFQRSEYLHEKGMIDLVVHRHNLRDTISSLVGILSKAPASKSSRAKMPAKPIEADDAGLMPMEPPPEAAHAE